MRISCFVISKKSVGPSSSREDISESQAVFESMGGSGVRCREGRVGEGKSADTNGAEGGVIAFDQGRSREDISESRYVFELMGRGGIQYGEGWVIGETAGGNGAEDWAKGQSGVIAFG